MTMSSKPVIYRGGLVSFNIPSRWREEYELQGGGTFYEVGEDTGTLRLNVLTFEKKENLSIEDVAREFFDGKAHEVLSSGFPMRH